MSSAAFTTYGPGEAPHIFLILDQQSSTDGSMTISGYLIDATN